MNSNTSSINAGGIYVQDDGSGDTTTFSGGSIDNNSTNTTATSGQGGGVYLLNNGTPSTASFSGGSISNNSAYEGGGVDLAPGSSPTRTGDLATFTNETVSGNNVTEAGGGFSDDAGAVQPLTIASSTISGNSAGTLATSNGGGIEAFAPPTTCDLITLTNDTITGNTAVNGGGYYGGGCTSPTVATAFKFDTISGNTATNTAGAGNIETIDGLGADPGREHRRQRLCLRGRTHELPPRRGRIVHFGRLQPDRQHELRLAGGDRHHRQEPRARLARQQRGADPNPAAGGGQPGRRGDPLCGCCAPG